MKNSFEQIIIKYFNNEHGVAGDCFSSTLKISNFEFWIIGRSLLGHQRSLALRNRCLWDEKHENKNYFSFLLEQKSEHWAPTPEGAITFSSHKSNDKIQMTPVELWKCFPASSSKMAKYDLKYLSCKHVSISHIHTIFYLQTA